MAARRPPDEDDFAAEPRSIDLREYWLVIRRRWILVLVVTLLGAVAGAGYAVTAGLSYTATSQVVVTGVTQGPLNPPSQVNLQVNMSTEQAVAQSPPVIEQAAGLMNTSAAGLEAAAAKRLTVTVPATSVTTSNVLQIAWKAGSPRAAQAGANAFANAYLSYRHTELASQIASLEAVFGHQVDSLDKQISHLTTELSRASAGSSAHQSLQIRLNELTGQASTAGNELASLPTYNDSGGSVISAALPTAPSGLGRSAILVLGVLLGLLIGLILAFVRDSFDDRVREPAQLERRLGAATLAVLPPPENVPDESRAARPVPSGASDLHRGQPGQPGGRGGPRAAGDPGGDGRPQERAHGPGCGRRTSVSSSRMAAGLGVALAESGRHVLLMAADMRGRPWRRSSTSVAAAWARDLL